MTELKKVVNISPTLQFDGDSLSADQLPQPTGWQILLAPIRITEKTSGGIILTQGTQNEAETIRFISKVLAVGPLAYSGDKFKIHPKQSDIKAWCKPGDIVSTGQYAGSQIPCLDPDGSDFYLRLVADDEIKTVIVDPTILNI